MATIGNKDIFVREPDNTVVKWKKLKIIIDNQ